MYDTSSLDYRPVSHGDTMSRNYQNTTAYAPSGTGTGYAGSERRDRSSGFANAGLLTQHANNSGSLSLLDRGQSYGNGLGTPGAEQRKSMQVHVGVADEDDAGLMGYEVPRYESRERRQSGQGGHGSYEGRERRQSHGRQRRESAREREYAY